MNGAHPSVERVVEYLHGELSAAEDAAIHAHLAGCPECDGKRGEELAITEALVSLYGAKFRIDPKKR